MPLKSILDTHHIKPPLMPPTTRIHHPQLWLALMGGGSGCINGWWQWWVAVVDGSCRWKCWVARWKNFNFLCSKLYKKPPKKHVFLFLFPLLGGWVGGSGPNMINPIFFIFLLSPSLISMLWFKVVLYMKTLLKNAIF